MRKDDIILTVPEKSTLYAYGTVRPGLDSPWADLDSWKGRHYVPCYVLGLDNGYAIVVLADHYPDSMSAKSQEQASLVDATGYSLADYRKREKALEKFSHWGYLSAEQREEREKVLKKLKQFPKGWTAKMVRSSDIRMFWAEYDMLLTEKIETRKVIAKEQAKTEKANIERGKHVVKRLEELGVLPPDDTRRHLYHSGDSLYYVPLYTLEALIEMAEKELRVG